MRGVRDRQGPRVERAARIGVNASFRTLGKWLLCTVESVIGVA